MSLSLETTETVEQMGCRDWESRLGHMQKPYFTPEEMEAYGGMRPAQCHIASYGVGRAWGEEGVGGSGRSQVWMPVRGQARSERKGDRYLLRFSGLEVVGGITNQKSGDSGL